MRGGLFDESDFDFANDAGLEHIYAVDIHHMGIEKTAELIRKKVGNNKVMVTFDIDFVDPAFAPGTGTPVSCGFTSRQALELIRHALIGLDFVVLGVPYDTSVTNRTGCRFGPRAIRNAYGAGRLSYEQDNSYKVANLRGMDMGDIGVVLGYVEETMELIRESVRKVLNAGAVPIVLGGDHLIAYAELKAYSEKYGKVAMVHFDTHEDTWDYGDRIKYNHGTPFRNAIEDDILDTEHSIQVGIRSGGDTYRIKYAQDHGMKVITARELHKIGIKETCRRIKEQVGDAKVFITFDIDFLDPAYAPGTGTPMPGGFSTYEACEIIRNGLAGLDIVGFDLVEVMENYDPTGITAINAVAILKQFVILLSKKKAEQE